MGAAFAVDACCLFPSHVQAVVPLMGVCSCMACACFQGGGGNKQHLQAVPGLGALGSGSDPTEVGWCLGPLAVATAGRGHSQGGAGEEQHLVAGYSTLVTPELIHFYKHILYPQRGAKSRRHRSERNRPRTAVHELGVQ